MHFNEGRNRRILMTSFFHVRRRTLAFDIPPVSRSPNIGTPHCPLTGERTPGCNGIPSGYAAGGVFSLDGDSVPSPAALRVLTGSRTNAFRADLEILPSNFGMAIASQ